MWSRQPIYVPFEISPQLLGPDASNFHISEPLTMALLLTIVFTTTKLNDFNFLATTVSNNFSFDYAAINERNADFDFFTVCDHQHFSELNSFASCDVQLFQANGLTFAYSVLFTTTLENRVHIKLRFRAHLFNDSECAINIHNRARILRKTHAFDKCYSQYTKKKNTTCTVTFICAIFSVQSPYIPNHKP